MIWLANAPARVTVKCEYGETGLPSTTVSFIPSVELGATAEAVRDSIERLRVEGPDPFFLPCADQEPLEFYRDTVAEVEVR